MNNGRKYCQSVKNKSVYILCYVCIIRNTNTIIIITNAFTY